MKPSILIAIFVLITEFAFCQNIVVTDDNVYNGNNSAMLDIKSTNKGLLIPRIALNSMTDNNTIVSPATGLMIYDIGTNINKGFYYWNGNRWTKFAAGNILSDDDGDTKITLESTPGGNEDYISFFTGIKGLNKEVIRINRNRLEFKNTGNSVFIGDSTGLNDDLNNNWNTYVGNNAGKIGSWNINCVFMGYKSGYKSNGSYFNTFVGTMSGINNMNGSSNTFIGDESGYFNTYGKENVFVGAYSGFHNTTGNWNVFIGKESGISNTTGLQNIFVGSYSGFKNTTGNYNTFVGDQSGYYNTTGYENTFLGIWAGTYNSTGYYNILIGANSGYSNTTGSRNVYLGNYTGQYNTTGNNNVFIGESAGKNNASGSNNVFIGKSAGIASLGSNNVFIGNLSGSNETGSNKLYIDNSASTTPLIYGDFTKDSLSVNGKLNVSGSVSMAVNVQSGCSYTATSNDYTILCNPATIMTINLPVASGAKGRIYIIKKLSLTGINNITIIPNGTETIDGAANKVLSIQYESIMIQSNGFNWFIIAKF